MRKSCVFFIALLVLAAVFTPRAFRRPQTNETEETKHAVTLTIDVIPAADVGSGSRAAWLRARAEAFEKTHENVYIRVRTLKGDQAARLYSEEDGSTGNIAAYSSGGFADDERFLSLDSIERDELIDTLLESGSETAVAYMYGGYVLLTDASVKEDADIEDEIRFMRVAVCCETDECGAAALAMSGLLPKETEILPRGEANAMFSARTCDALVASHYTAYRFWNLARQGKTEPVTILPLGGGFADQVHYVSVVPSMPRQDEAALAFVEYLLSKDAQETLGNIGMFSVLSSVRRECGGEEGSLLSRLFECEQETALCPNVFLWQMQRQTAQELAADVLQGGARGPLQNLLITP